MKNLAYYHDACVSRSAPIPYLCLKNIGFNWKQLSSWAWKFLLPLALNLAILNIASQTLALERGDTGPEVRNLQEQLKSAGFFDIDTTEFYGSITEDAVRRFQQANGLDVDGIAGPATIGKLQTYLSSSRNSSNSSPSTQNPSQNSKDGNTYRRGDSGDAVKVIQEQLSAAGFFKGTPTGTFGPVTEEAVREFQTAHNIIANGIVGSATQRELKKYGTGGEAPVNNPTTKDTLRRGDSGDTVKVLQQQLNKAGFYNGSATGNFGPFTEDAVRRFQESHSLTATGIVGPTTRQALLSSQTTTVNTLTSINTTTVSPRQTLHLGDHGEDVKSLQQQLKTVGFYNSSPTAQFDQSTETAVRQFQATHYLAESGIAGPTTRAKLQEAISSVPVAQFSIFDLQKRLQKKGFYEGPIDGNFGPLTKAALLNAQQFYGVSEADIKSGHFQF